MTNLKNSKCEKKKKLHLWKSKEKNSNYDKTIFFFKFDKTQKPKTVTKPKSHRSSANLGKGEKLDQSQYTNVCCQIGGIYTIYKPPEVVFK